MKQQRKARKSVAPRVRRDDRPSSAPSSPSSSPSPASSLSGNDISKSSVLRIRDTFASSSYLGGVYCERDKGDLSVLAEGAWK